MRLREPLLSALLHDRRGTVTILSAVLLPVLIGMAALVAEFGHGLLIRTENQRVADVAAYAGAVAYNAGQSTAAMNAAIANVAALNGMPSGSVTGALVASPAGNGNQAVSVTVATTKLLLLAPVLGGSANLGIGTAAQVEIGAQASACVIALSASQTGITLSGGTNLNVPACGVASNNTVTVPCGTFVTTRSVDYNSSSTPSVGCGGIQPPSGTASVTMRKQATADPLAANAGKTAAVSRLATVAGYSAPAGPAVPTVTAPSGGTAIEFGWNQSATQSQATAAGCTAAWASGTNTWTLTCPAGTRNFGALTIGGGIKLRFNTGGPASNVYNFSAGFTTSDTTVFGPGIYTIAGNLTTNGTTSFGEGALNLTGNLVTNGTTTFAQTAYRIVGTVTTNGTTSFASGPVDLGGLLTTTGTTTFGSGTFNLARGLATGGGSTTTFGTGTFNVGVATGACNWGSERFSICHTGTTLTLGGPSTFTLPGGLFVNGGSTAAFGSGSQNSYVFGPSLAASGSGGGNAVSLGGGAKLRLADATGSGNLFRLVGNLNVAAGGGSCLTLPANPNQDIKGSLLTAGGTRLGSGVYTVTGYVALGGNGGGDVSCDGQTVGMIGTGITVVIGADTTPSSGSCQGRAFCIGAGYGTVTLTAPTTGTTANFVVIGPIPSANAAGALFTAGASNTSLSGAFYVPNGPIDLSGGASVGNGSGQCLEVIGSRITLTGGTALGSRCIASTNAGTTAMLIR